MTKNAPFKFKPADWAGFFREHGWQAKEIRYMSQEGERLKRPAQLPLFLKGLILFRMLLASKQRREEFKKMAGYALMQPIATAVANI
jgi:hypothetical protein